MEGVVVERRTLTVTPSAAVVSSVSDAMVTVKTLLVPDFRKISRGPLASRVLKPGKRSSRALLWGDAGAILIPALSLSMSMTWGHFFGGQGQ